MRTELLVVFLLPALTLQAGSDDLVVSLTNGKVRGGYVTVKGTERRVKQYLGIPFARPPVGPLRLAPPQDAQPWEGERDGTHHPPMCIQDAERFVNVSRVLSMTYSATELSEDCLYLNVFTTAEAKRGGKLPVMVWIHGGGLVIGAASHYDGAPLAAYENMVTVFVQYRLGILGFLSTGDEHARGNWGFLDQLAALRWVQENIGAFGGDPQTVTVAGESAGGISASLLTLSPQAKGLFQRAIFQSGVATLGSSPTSHAPGYAKIVADLSGCEHSSSQDLVRCMRGKSTEQLLRATEQMKIYLGGVVDGDFLPDEAEELLKRKEVMKVPAMMGITNHEFGWLLPQSFAPPGWENGMNRESVLAVMNMFYPAGAAAANSIIADEYLKDAKTPEDIRDGFTEVMGDLLMMMPVIKVAGYHVDAGIPVYLYEFVHQAEIYQHTRPHFVKSDHADDVVFMFGACFWNGHIKIGANFTKDDEGLCRSMMSYWANFARNGSPDGPGLVSWPQYSRQKQEYMELGITQTVRQKLKEDRVHFFTVTLRQKLEQAAAAAAPGN